MALRTPNPILLDFLWRETRAREAAPLCSSGDKLIRPRRLRSAPQPQCSDMARDEKYIPSAGNGAAVGDLAGVTDESPAFNLAGRSGPVD